MIPAFADHDSYHPGKTDSTARRQSREILKSFVRTPRAGGARLPPVQSRLLAASLLAWAVDTEADWRLSVFAGPSCDAPAVEDGASFDSRCSVQPLLGAAASVSGPGRWRFETEATYSRRSFESSAFVTDNAVRAEFLELALLAAWPLREGSSYRITAVLGPQVGLRLRARRRFRDVDQDVTDELRPADLKLVGALRLSRRTGRGEAFLEGRLGFGVTNLDDTNQQEIHSRGFAVKVGFAR